MDTAFPPNPEDPLGGTPPEIPADSPPDKHLHALYQELAEKTGLLQATFGSIDQGILMVDANGRISTYNHRVCELLDLPASLLASQPTAAELTRFQWQRGDFGPEGQLLSPDLRGAVLKSDGLQVPQSYTRTTRAGLVLQVKTQHLEGGGLVRTYTDVTSFTRAEQARERLNALLTGTQTMAQVGGWEVDVAHNTVFWTDEVYRMLDTSPAEYTPTIATLGRFFSEESARQAKAAIKLATRHHTDGTAAPFDLEVEMLSATGRPLWVHIRTVVTMEKGRIVKRVSMMQDITARKKVEAELRASEENFRQITAQVPGMVFQLLFNREGAEKYSFVSDGIKDLYGVTPEALMADSTILRRFRHPDDEEIIEADLRQAATSRLPLLMQFRIRFEDGSVKWLQVSSAVIAEHAGGLVRSGIMTDITARKQTEMQLHESEERWKLALESTGDGVWDWNLQTGVEIYSKRYIEMYGYQEGELRNLAEDFDAMTHPDDLAQLARDRQAHFDGSVPTYQNEHRVLCKDGTWKWILTRGMVISRDAQGRPLRMIGTHTDISSRKQSEALIWQQANFDALTGLPNRRMLRDRLAQDIHRCKRQNSRLAILFIDLDHFKEVNDTLGHDKGDLLLVEAAHRIRAHLRESDTVARMGGDEFTVVLTDLPDADSTERIVSGILGAMAQVFQFGEEQVFVSASIGVTTYPDDAMEVEELFTNADQALYVAKGAGRNRFSFFTPALQEAAQNRARLAIDLRAGVAHQQFHMVYQPIVSLATGAVYKAEALIRWQHPTRGLISPAEFIPIAETSGLIIDIGDWVFREVTRQVKIWRNSLRADFQLSVNKSPVQFHHASGNSKAWLEHLAALGLPGNAVTVEITEGLLLEVSSGAADQLLELRDAGVQVSLDDFGTGYSSLSYLQKFEIDYIKIDQSFIRHLIPASTDLTLCKAIIMMAHELGMKVVAEGIETEQQRDLLVAAGCDYGQGYLFAHPMKVADFEAFMLKHESKIFT